MANSINNFVIDHVLRGIMTNSNGEYLWSVNQITNPSLSVTTENSQAVDALGSVIAEFDRARNAQFSAENSLFDLGLYAAQMGQSKNEASDTNKIEVPMFETVTLSNTNVDGSNLEATQTSGGKYTYVYTLKKVPVEDIKYIYKLNGDGTLGTKFTLDTSAGESKFAYDSSSHKVSIPTSLIEGEQVFIMYNYKTNSGASVTADGINFPKGGKFTMEVLGVDTCDPDTVIYAYLIFPNAKLDSNIDYSFQTDGTHPFTIKALQDYCDSEKKLFTIVIPSEEE